MSCEPPFIEKGDYCVYLTEPTTFENGCNVKAHELFNVTLYEQMETEVWLPVKRRYSFGPFVFVNPSDEYAETVMSVLGYFDYDGFDDSWSTCMTTVNKTMFHVDCLKKHPHLCAYYNDDNDDCNSPALSFEKCYCKLMYFANFWQWEIENNHDDYCEFTSDFTMHGTIIELETELETTGENVCYSLNYESNATSCAVERQNIPKADLILKFDVKRKQLLLTVYSYEG